MHMLYCDKEETASDGQNIIAAKVNAR